MRISKLYVLEKVSLESISEFHYAIVTKDPMGLNRHIELVIFSHSAVVWADIIAAFGLTLTSILLALYLLRITETFSLRLPWWRLFEVNLAHWFALVIIQTFNLN